MALIGNGIQQRVQGHSLGANDLLEPPSFQIFQHNLVIFAQANFFHFHTDFWGKLAKKKKVDVPFCLEDYRPKNPRSTLRWVFRFFHRLVNNLSFSTGGCTDNIILWKIDIVVLLCQKFKCLFDIQQIPGTVTV